MGTTSEILKNYLFRFIILVVVPSYAIYLLGYQTVRSDTYRLWFLMIASLLPYIVLTKPSFQLSFKNILILGIWLRLILLFSIPALSDDYFRFIWDGRLSAQGINPFLHSPSYYLEQGFPIAGVNLEIYPNLNSKEYFSIYPPVCQFIFWIGALISSNNVLVHVIMMKIFFILIESGTIYFLYLLLKHLKKDIKILIWYALNPLIILELVGNLHFEAFMIFGLVGSLYFLLVKKNWVFSALLFAIAINAKLLPLMLLPLFLFPLGFKKAFCFYLVTGAFVLVMFIPFLSKEMILNISDSVGLYFKKFEFNASIYYVVRWVGFQVKGYNIIGTAGKNLSLIPIFFILILSFIRGKQIQSIATKVLWVLAIYFFSATIVHPWYITHILALCLLTSYRFPLIWLILAMLSYATYQTDAYEENLWLTAVEYLAVYSIAGYELYRNIEWKKEVQPLYLLKDKIAPFFKKP